MTEKDLLDSLRFVDDDLIEEAGLEQLKEEKQKKINGKVIFLRTALTAAAGPMAILFSAFFHRSDRLLAIQPAVPYRSGGRC